MEKAKNAVEGFMSKSGHHDTTTHETVSPAVTNETISKQHHDEKTVALDREVHQDHYHTTVQPVTDREVLPEQHSHRVIPVEHREHHHGKDNAIKESLQQEAAQFRDTRTAGTTTQTQSTAPTLAGEHVHHHVHENIQPVIQKETIQPSVVHTAIPIHETHHHDPKHHAATALPAVNMAGYKAQGGTLGGREERSDGFIGDPNPIGSAMKSTATTGPHESTFVNKLDPRVDSDRDGSRNMGLAKDTPSAVESTRTTAPTGHTSTGVTGPTSTGPATTGTTGATSTGPAAATRATGPTGTTSTTGATGTGTAPTTGSIGPSGKIEPTSTTGTTATGPATTGFTGSGHTGKTDTPIYDQFSRGQNSGLNEPVAADTTSTSTKKPSLLDRLNPKKDADGDGKRGIFN